MTDEQRHTDPDRDELIANLATLEQLPKREVQKSPTIPRSSTCETS